MQGLTRQAVGDGGCCSLCRKEIPAGYLSQETVLTAAGADIDTETADTGPEWVWFYEGRSGWWRFEERNNQELEEAFEAGEQSVEMMICGQLYVMDLAKNEQYPKNFPTRKRKIKRDVKTSESKGVAGLMKRK